MKRRNFIKGAGALLAALLPVGLLAKKRPKDDPYTHEQLMDSNLTSRSNVKMEYFNNRLCVMPPQSIKCSEISGDFGSIWYDDTYSRVNIK